MAQGTGHDVLRYVLTAAETAEKHILKSFGERRLGWQATTSSKYSGGSAGINVPPRRGLLSETQAGNNLSQDDEVISAQLVASILGEIYSYTSMLTQAMD